MVKGAAIGLLALFAILIVLARRAMKKPVTVGREAMVGQVGVATTDIAPDGTVKLKGELWRATSEKRIRKGEEVVVKDMKGLVLIVEKRGKK